MGKIKSVMKIFLLLLPSLYFVYKGIYDNYSDRLSFHYSIEILLNIAPVITFFIVDSILINRQNRLFLSFLRSVKLLCVCLFSSKLYHSVYSF
jgi:hypothetical protein